MRAHHPARTFVAATPALVTLNAHAAAPRAGTQMKAALIVTNANVRTPDARATRAEAVAVYEARGR